MVCTLLQHLDAKWCFCDTSYILSHMLLCLKYHASGCNSNIYVLAYASLPFCSVWLAYRSSQIFMTL